MSSNHYESIAVERIQLITPLLDPSLDPAKKVALRKQLAEKSGISERTIRRYEAAFQQTGFIGLKPKSKQSSRQNTLPSEIINEAIQLRREVPTRSVGQIIQILEWEGKISLGQVPRSTLQENLAKAGYSSTTMRSYKSGGVAARRFQAAHRNDLWHSDIKYGPVLAIGPQGKFKQVYLVVFLDDATRYVLHAAFYDSLDHKIVKDSFRQALIHHGLPKAVYFDNGGQYRNELIKRACAKLNIRLLYAKPYCPESTGKIERFNQNIDKFLAEVRIDKPSTLDELNKQLWVWLDVCYQHQGHSALPSHISPDQCYRSDKTPQNHVDVSTITDAFMHSEQRKVDKVGCISLKSKKYEVGMSLIGLIVTIVYDQSDLSEITVEAEHHEPFKAKELKIGARAGQRPSLPDRLVSEPPKHSRILSACESESSKIASKVRQAISYSSMIKGGEGDV